MCARVEVDFFTDPEFRGTLDGNSAVGVIACGDQGLTDVSYKLVQDHVTDPGSPNNGNSFDPVIGLQNPDDPECDDEFVFPGSGVVSAACLEFTGDPLCNEDDDRGQHPDVCNGPRVIEFFGGPVPRGSALIANSTSIGLLNDAGLCNQNLEPGDSRCPEDYGPDCKPCTDDDEDLGDPENLPTTTGVAAAAVFDATNSAGRTIDALESAPSCTVNEDCEPGQLCVRQCTISGDACDGANPCARPDETCEPPACSWNGCGVGNFRRRCIVSAEGDLFDCEAMASDDGIPANGDGDGMSGAALGVTFPAIDSRRIGDNVTSTVLDLE